MPRLITSPPSRFPQRPAVQRVTPTVTRVDQRPKQAAVRAMSIDALQQLYASDPETATQEATRRGMRFEVSTLPTGQNIVRLVAAKQGAQSRTRPKRTAATPTWRELMARGMDKETALRMASQMKEDERQSRSPEYGIAETREREKAAKEAGDKLKIDKGRADIEAKREYIESKGGSIGVLSEAEAARADRTYTTLKRYEVGEGQYDITAALHDRAFTAAELREMGFSQGAVSDATERVSKSSYPEKVGSKAKAQASLASKSAGAFAGSKGSAEAAGQDMTSVRPAPSTQKAGLIGNVLLLAFRNRDGSYNLQRMVESKFVSARNIRDAGFTDAQITAAIEAAQRASAVKGTVATVGGLTAFSGTGTHGGKGPSIATVDPNKAEPTSTGLKAAATRNLLLRYQNKDASYDLQKAVEKGVSVKMLQTAGFSDAQIMAAINAAMKDLSEQQLRELSEATGTEPRKPAHKPQSQDERVAALAKVMGQVNAQVERDMAAQEAKSRDIIREAERTSVALPGEERTWYHWPTGQTVSDYEYRRATKDGSNAKAEEYSLSAPSARRGVIETVSSLFPSVRSALPEVGRKDITVMDHLVTAASVAAFAVPFMPKGTGPAVLQVGAGSVFALSAADNWEDMSPAGRTLITAASVLSIASGLHGIVQPSFKAVKVPLNDGGEAIVWRGLSIRGKPIIGVTKLPPNINDVPIGWRPITRAEKTLLGTKKMLEKMGVPDDEVKVLLKGYQETKEFQPLRSPYEPKKARAGDFAPQSLTPDEFTTVLKQTVKNEKLVEGVYGSVTIKMQLDPKLRNWRKLGDVEVQLKPGVTEPQAAKLADDILTAFNKSNPGKFRIDPADPKRILVTGGHHAVELKLAEVSKLGVEAKYSLTRTGEMSWGLKVAQKPITVDFPGVGKLRIMRLSESGVRKFDSISRHAGGGTFGPAEHRTKDIIDYYVILRTFKGPDVADKWARLFGLDPKAALKAAMKDPPKLDAWEFLPGQSPATGSPSVRLSIPPSMAARVQASSPALYKVITSPSVALSPAARVASSPVASAPAYTTATMPSAASVMVEDEESPTPSVPMPSEESPSPGGSSPSPAPPGSSQTATAPTTTAPSPGTGSPPPVPTSIGGAGGGGTSPSPSVGGVPRGGTSPGAGRQRNRAVAVRGYRVSLTPGKFAWRQGAYWIQYTPPYSGNKGGDLQYSRAPFPDARRLKGSPNETFYTRGERIPDEVRLEMGISNVHIRPAYKPPLKFTRRRTPVQKWQATVKWGRRSR